MLDEIKLARNQWIPIQPEVCMNADIVMHLNADIAADKLPLFDAISMTGAFQNEFFSF